MVRPYIVIFFILPFVLFSAEFVERVNRHQVHLGESVTLTLMLKDATAHSPPEIEALSHVFHIESQQQSNSLSIVNGKMSSQTIWKLVLIPKTEGIIQIPAISVQTSEGLLTSRPINIEVAARGEGGQPSSGHPKITAAVGVSNAHPYKAEPFVYTVRLMSPNQVSNIQIEKFHIEDAIVEAHGEPNVYTQIHNGIHMLVVDIHYLITPLKPGTLKFPSVILRGVTPAERQQAFEHEFDFFSMMSGLNRLEPFIVTTPEGSVEVQAPIGGMQPWIPAKSFHLEEEWEDKQVFRVGEPFVRKLSIQAEGIKVNQLPDLGEIQKAGSQFKVYADKPELKEEMREGTFYSHKKEQYTLIPQSSGSLVLPEISLEWWDVVKKEKKIAKIPARTIEVLPSSKSFSPNGEEVALVDQHAASVLSTLSSPNDNFLSFVIWGLILVIIALLLGIFVLLKKLLRVQSHSTKEHTQLGQKGYNPFNDPDLKEKTTTKEKKESLPDLNPT